jgi:hypothetical protein
MAKYIDADKLIAEIDDRLHCNGAFDEVGDSSWHYDQGMVDAYKHIREVVASLQQEQSEVDFENMIKCWIKNHVKGGDIEPYKTIKNAVIKWGELVARHFYELGKNSK